MNHRIQSSSSSSPLDFIKILEAVDFIKRLLQAKATRRLGIIRGGSQTMRSHEWFEGFSWEKLNAGQLRAPIILKIKDNTDLSHFDKFDRNVCVFRGIQPL